VHDPLDRIGEVYKAVGKDLFGSEHLRVDLDGRDQDEAAFFTLVLVAAEIDNGGFAQLFTNSTGELIGEAITGAHRFGLSEHARVLVDASGQLFPGGVPLDHKTRLQRWDDLIHTIGGPGAVDAALDALDARWYALADTLEQRLAVYAAGRADV
jgi:Domain of unknown function (DUF4375)